MSALNLNGTTFEYTEQGSGDTVLLVHGTAGDYRTWEAQLDAFGKHYRTLAYSRRYHWPNDRIPDDADYSMMQHVDDLQALVQSLGSAPVHLVGHSYGGFICLLLAMRSPELVRSLVLSEPPVITLFVSNKPKPSELLKLLLTRPRTAIALMKFGATGVEPANRAARNGDLKEALRISGTAVLGAEYYRHLSPERLEQALANTIRAEFLGSGFAPLDDDAVRGVRVPTLLLNGQNSPAIFHRLVDRLVQLLPHVERHEVVGASHIMHEDNAPDYNAAVLAFLNRQQ